MDIDLGTIEIKVDEATFVVNDGGIDDIIALSEARKAGNLQAIVKLFTDNLVSIDGVKLGGKPITVEQFVKAKIPLGVMQKILTAHSDKLTAALFSSIEAGQAEKNVDSSSVLNGVSTSHV